MKKILLLATGGTITSVPSADGFVPGQSQDILQRICQSSGHDVTVQELFSMDSSNIQPEEWKGIARAVYNSYGAYSGIVITHGTDTMAYTASMLSFMLKHAPIPIVLTGAQVPLSSSHTDAYSNLDTAITMAATGHPGVFVAFDRKILLGCRTVKIRTTSYAAFASVNYPVIAYINTDGLVIDHTALATRIEQPPQLVLDIDSDVALIKLTPNLSPRLLDAIIDSGFSGIAIEAFGVGGMQFIRRNWVESLSNASAKGIPVVVCSQCLYEQSDFSRYQVGQKVLNAGAIEAFDMTSESAVTKLMFSLGQTKDLGIIRDMFNTNYVGEISPLNALK